MEKAMKSKPLPSCGGKLARGLLLVALAANCSLAQNFVKNPDFEEPLGPDNWTIVYVYPSGPADFLVAGRTTMASKDIVGGTWDGGWYGSTNYWSKFGGHFQPNHVGLVHAYFRQVVSGLQPGASYACGAWMVQYTSSGNANHLAQVYLETIGTTTKSTPIVTANAYNNPGAWALYSVTNTANANGEIELRLHYNKTVTISYANNPWEYRNCHGFFDHVSVMPEGQTEYQPPYSIVSASRSGSDLTLQWETVMNNRYRLQAATNLTEPVSWFPIERNPRLDTNFIATGSSYTFKTNVESLFYYDPATAGVRPEWRTPLYFDPNGPLFFRISSTPFVP
jgi:hypothetical protein